MRILGFVIGETYQAVLAAAQAGDEGAFSALWRDANPALLRYLRVIAPEAAEDVAADTWVHVVRGLATFRGDESAWRAWLFTTARRRVIDDARYRARRPATPMAENATAVWFQALRLSVRSPQSSRRDAWYSSAPIVPTTSTMRS